MKIPVAGVLAGLSAAFSALTYFQSAGASQKSPPPASAMSPGSRPATAVATPGRAMCIMSEIKATHCKEG